MLRLGGDFEVDVVDGLLYAIDALKQRVLVLDCVARIVAHVLPAQIAVDCLYALYFFVIEALYAADCFVCIEEVDCANIIAFLHCEGERRIGVDRSGLHSVFGLDPFNSVVRDGLGLNRSRRLRTPMTTSEAVIARTAISFVLLASSFIRPASLSSNRKAELFEPFSATAIPMFRRRSILRNKALRLSICLSTPVAVHIFGNPPIFRMISRIACS